MIKKIIIGLAILIGVISITLNIAYYYDVKEALKPIEHDGNRLFNDTMFFGFNDEVASNTSEQVNLTPLQQAELLQAIDSAFHSFSIIQDELIGTSGGRDPETGSLMNPSSTSYTYQYFFETNNFRSYGLDYFNQALSNYLNTVHKLNYNSRIYRGVELHNEYIERPFFENLTVAESFNFIEILKANLIIDKYLCLLTKKEQID